MENIRLRIEYGSLAVEAEAPEQFIKSELVDLLGELCATEFFGKQPMADLAVGGIDSGPSSGNKFEYSTDTIASLTNAKTGPDLALAAAAHLALVKAKTKFLRKEILDEMQGATTFYSNNYSGNLTKILQSLTKAKKLNLVASQTYALSKSEHDKFQSILAGD